MRYNAAYAANGISGDPTPSEADIRVTGELARAGKLLRIELLDHVIIGRPGLGHASPFISLLQAGFLH